MIFAALLGLSLITSPCRGLCLIVMTTASHSLGIVLISILGLRIRVGLKHRRVAFWQGVAMLKGLIAAIGLSLAVLHGIEAALWATAYLGLARSTTRPRQCFPLKNDLRQEDSMPSNPVP